MLLRKLHFKVSPNPTFTVLYISSKFDISLISLLTEVLIVHVQLNNSYLITINYTRRRFTFTCKLTPRINYFLNYDEANFWRASDMKFSNT